MTSMTYYHSAGLTSQLALTGQGSSYVFKLNSLHDPDATGVGHQPYGRDQWAAFYNKYYVYKTYCEVWINNTNLDVISSGTWALYRSKSILGDISPVANQPYAVLERLKAPATFARMKRSTAAGTAGPNSWTRLKGMFKTRSVGDGRFELEDLTGGLNSSSDPIETRGIHLLGIFPQAGATTVSNYIQVRLKQYCILFDPVQLGVS